MVDKPEILICDDEENILDLLELQLKDIDKSCLRASDGNEAYMTISENMDIKLVITDIMMPNMRGHELIESLNITNEDLKVIVITGYGMDESVRRLCDYPQVVAIVAKPWKKDELLKLVNEALK
jgi:two-component system cell cycle sensor histidine kinase/response regulator CckA